MRVGIDARELCGQPAGKGQYLERIVRSWFIKADYDIFLYVKVGQIVPDWIGEMATVVFVKGAGPVWHWRVGHHAKSSGVDVFFAALTYQSALFNAMPTVTVVHDLAVFMLPELVHNKRAKWVERVTLKQCVRKSAAIIAVSESTARDLISLIPGSKNKISVVLEAPLLMSDVGQPLSRSERGNYLLFVGTLEPRKNMSGLLKAYALVSPDLRAKYHLRIVGKQGWGGEDYMELAKGLEVEFMGYQSSEDLIDLYRKAMIVVYPSLYEGFGLPVVEALAVGTPVITSNTSSLPEVMGDGTGLMIDPNDHAQLAEAITLLLTDESGYTNYSQAAFARVKQFSWETAASETASILERVK